MAAIAIRKVMCACLLATISAFASFLWQAERTMVAVELPIQVFVNGHTFSINGMMHRGEVNVPVADLARAVNGSTQIQPRLQVLGRTLMTLVSGSCDYCPLRINRSGVISGKVERLPLPAGIDKRIAPTLIFPLSDLLRALDGKVEGSTSEASILITTPGTGNGSCLACILQPRPIRVLLNNELLSADAVNRGGRLYMPVADLAHAVDDEGVVESRLSFDGLSLATTRPGRCSSCLLQVNKVGTITRAVGKSRFYARPDSFPLDDLIAAIGGWQARSDVESVSIRASLECDYCLLSPARISEVLPITGGGPPEVLPATGPGEMEPVLGMPRTGAGAAEQPLLVLLAVLSVILCGVGITLKRGSNQVLQ